MALKRLVKWPAWEFNYLKYVQSTRKFCLTLQFKNNTVNIEPKTVYMRRDNDNAHFIVSIAVDYPPLGLNKVMNFRRPLDSPLMQLLQRINCKVYSQLDKIKHKKKRYNDVEVPQVNALLYFNDELLPDDTICGEIFNMEGKLILNMLSEQYEIHRNLPWVNAMTLPKSVKSEMVIHPIKFDALNTNIELSSFFWFRSGESVKKSSSFFCQIKDWVPHHEGYFYEVTEDDVGHYLRLDCIPRNEKSTGPIVSEFVMNPIDKAECDYYFKGTHLLTSEIPKEDEIRFVTYNVLAAMYTNTKEGKALFDYCPASVIDKNQRFPAIARELAGYNADVICLQEAEMHTFQNYIMPRLTKLGYIGFIAPKTQDKEGTACIINRNKFRILGSQTYLLGKESGINPALYEIHKYLKQNEEFHRKYISLPHSLQMVALKLKAKPDEVLLVANVHLYSAPDADLARLLQALTVMILLETFKMEMKSALSDCKTSYILCGDFNSTPDSSIHECIMNGGISPDHAIWQSGDMKASKGLTFQLPQKMDSACGTPEFTNYTKSFKGCLDYIYYETEKLQVEKVYPMPSEAELRKHVGLPSLRFPSDHIPLIVDMKLK